MFEFFVGLLGNGSQFPTGENADFLAIGDGDRMDLTQIDGCGYSILDGDRHDTILDNRLLDTGKAPILLEPVKATLAIRRRAVAAVKILDHDGRSTGRTLSVTNSAFTIDGAKDHALYYEVVFR